MKKFIHLPIVVFIVVASFVGIAGISDIGGMKPAFAAGAPLILTDQDKEAVVRLENYLNGLKTLKSRFMQMTSDGVSSQGDFYLSRPGRLHIAYDTQPIKIVSNGTYLLYQDTELEQKSYVLLSSTPASILVQENISLTKGEMQITRLKQGSNIIRVTLANKEDAFGGEITLIFTDKPLMLRQWTIYDAQGTITDFALVKPRFGLKLDPALFTFNMLPEDKKRKKKDD